jgi:hypothetical protein
MSICSGFNDSAEIPSVLDKRNWLKNKSKEQHLKLGYDDLAV